MDTEYRSFTPYEDVDGILHQLHTGVKTLLGEVFCGMYIHGSLALGDFNPKSSDIDFLILLTRKLTETEITNLKQLYTQLILLESDWAKKLEGSFITIDQLKMYNPPKEPRPYVNGGIFSFPKYGSEWVLEKHVLLTHGIRIEGLELTALIEPVQPDQLITATFLLFTEWWEPMIEEPALLNTAEYQTYAILTMCRILYTIRFGKIVSKPEAANWMKHEFADLWKTVITKAEGWQHGMNLHLFDEAIALIKFTQEYCSAKHFNIQHLNR